MGSKEIWERIHQLHAGVSAHCRLSQDPLQEAAPGRPHVERSSRFSATSRSAPCNLTPAKLLGIQMLPVEWQSSHKNGSLLGSPSALLSSQEPFWNGGWEQRQKQELNLVQCTQLLQIGQSIWHLSFIEETSFYLQDYNDMGNGTPWLFWNILSCWEMQTFTLFLLECFPELFIVQTSQSASKIRKSNTLFTW